MYTIDIGPNRVIDRVARPHSSIRKQYNDQNKSIFSNNELHMFEEDIRNRIHYGQGIEKKEIEVVLHSSSSTVDSSIARGLAPRRHSNYSALRHSLRDFLTTCFGDFFYHGIAIHEIAYEHERKKGQLEPPDQFRLIRVDPQSVRPRWWRFGKLVQRTSHEDQSELGLPKYIPIQGERFLIARLPNDLGTPLQQAVDGLNGTALHEVLSTFPLWEKPSVRQTGAYNFDEHTATRRAVIAGATREIGWIGRGELNEDANGHYLVRRQIRFERYVAKLRRFLISHLNNALERLGSTIGFDAEVELQNAPQPSDYDEAEQALEEGAKSLREIMSDIGR